MILISKEEAKKMRENGFEKYVKSSHSRNKKYYLVESQKCLNFLEQYRNNRVILTR